jgi:homocitrate synthase NifV
MLDFLGVDIIEAGIPAAGEKERVAVSLVNNLGLQARITTLNRISLGDIRASLACGVKDIHISAPVSEMLIKHRTGHTKQWVLDCTRSALRYAGDHGCRVSVGAEDASRADWGFLIEFALLAREMGADRFRYADSMGILEPPAVYESLSRLGEELQEIDLEFQSGNAAAVFNSAAAARAGAKYVVTAVGGKGEPSGSADLKQFIAVLGKVFALSPKLRLNMVNRLERYVNGATRKGPCEERELYLTGNQ